MAHSLFSERLGFARWLRHLHSGEAPGNAELARVVDRTGQWLTRWADSSEPPTDFRVHGPLATYLGVDERWLFRNEGPPPEPMLWAVWESNAERRAEALADAVIASGGKPDYLKVAERHGISVATVELPGRKTAPAKKVASAGKKRPRR